MTEAVWVSEERADTVKYKQSMLNYNDKAAFSQCNVHSLLYFCPHNC